MAIISNGPRKFRKAPHTTRWAQVRTQGKSHFLWYYGVLGVGLPIAIFKIVFDLYHKGEGLPVLSFILNLILFPIFGLLIGFLTWTISERRFKRRQKSRDSEQIGGAV